MKEEAGKIFKFRVDIDLKIIASIKAKDAFEARELIEEISTDEYLNTKLMMFRRLKYQTGIKSIE
jgi:hypothetical protein